MKKLSYFLLSAFSMAFMTAALAVPPGMTVEFTKSPMGKVVFDGKFHADKGLLCDACHPAVFEQKKGTAKITIADHEAGQKFCFTCHNGGKSFAPKDNCNRCHQKPQ